MIKRIFIINYRARDELVRSGKRFSSASSSTDEGCCSVEGDLEEMPNGDELRDAQLKLEQHRLGLDRDISQRIDSQIINRRLSDYQQRQYEAGIFGFNNSNNGSSSSEVFESSFDSGCPPDYAASNGFTSSLPSCTPPPPKSPSPVLSRVSRISQARRASDAGLRLYYSQQTNIEDRPVKQRSIQGKIKIY